MPGPLNDAVDATTRRREEMNKRHLEGKENVEKVEEALRQARVSFLEEFERLCAIAVDVFNGRRGSFLKKYADAFLHADPYNKRLMRPVWEAFIRKYNLEEDPTGTGAPASEPGQKG